MLKSLLRKKLHSYFHSEPGSEPTDLQNYKLLRTCALAHAAMCLCTNFVNNNQCALEEFHYQYFKPLAQESATT